MQKIYKLSILYYLIFTMLLVVSAIMIFEYKIGFSYIGVLEYYIGNEEKFIPAQTTMGILKIVLPHIFVFGLISMVLLHFIVFTKKKYKKFTIYLIYLTFITAFLDIFTPLLIVNGFELFAYIKLLSFFMFLIFIVYISWLIFYSITQE